MDKILFTQAVYNGICLVILLFGIFQGWFQGLGRMTFKLVGLICGILVICYGGSALKFIADDLLPYASRLNGFIAAIVGGIFVYVSISVLGRFIYKKTSELEGIRRTIFGISGSLCGILIGSVYIVILLAITRTTIILLLAFSNNDEQSKSREFSLPGANNTNFSEYIGILEMSPITIAYNLFDPLYPEVYERFRKLIYIFNNKEPNRRFFAHPKIQIVLQQPTINIALNDPEVNFLLKSKKIHTLLKNNHVKAAIDDPNVSESIKDISIDAVIDEVIN